MAARVRFVVAAIVVVAACLLTADAARATWLPGPSSVGSLSARDVSDRGDDERCRRGSGRVRVRGAAGQQVRPGQEGYPSSNPTTGFQPQDEWFAGIILGTPASGGSELRLYCIDLHTETWDGIGYGLGDWSDADVPNVGYVARVLADYYPNTNEPSALTDINEKAAVVQAAVWFFTDRYVLSTSDPLHDGGRGARDQP